MAETATAVEVPAEVTMSPGEKRPLLSVDIPGEKPETTTAQAPPPGNGEAPSTSPTSASNGQTTPAAAGDGEAAPKKRGLTVVTNIEPIGEAQQHTAPPAKTSPGQSESTNIFVAGVPTAWGDSHLREAFGSFGDIISTRIVSARHYAFVMFKNQEQAHRAINMMHMHRPEGYTNVLHVSIAMHDEGSGDTANERIFIRGLPQWTTRDNLRAAFAEFGEIVEISVLMNQYGLCKGAGFLSYRTVEQANEAVKGGGGVRLENWNFPLEVKFSETVEARQSRQQRNLDRLRTSAANTPKSAGTPSGGLVPPPPQYHAQLTPTTANMRSPGGPPAYSMPQVPFVPQGQGAMGPPPYAGGQQPVMQSNVAFTPNGSMQPQPPMMMQPPMMQPPQQMTPPANATPMMQPPMMQPQQQQQQQQQSTPLQTVQQQQQPPMMQPAPQGQPMQQMPPAQLSPPTQPPTMMPPTQQPPAQQSPQQQQQQQQQQTFVLPAPGSTFPVTGDLLLTGVPGNETTARQLLQQYGTVEFMKDGGQGMFIVRLHNVMNHVKAAQVLNGTTFSTGHVMQVALVA